MHHARSRPALLRLALRDQAVTVTLKDLLLLECVGEKAFDRIKRIERLQAKRQQKRSHAMADVETSETETDDPMDALYEDERVTEISNGMFDDERLIPVYLDAVDKIVALGHQREHVVDFIKGELEALGLPDLGLS